MLSRPFISCTTGVNNQLIAHHYRAKAFGQKLMSSIPRQYLSEICARRTRVLILDLLQDSSNFQNHIELCTASISSQMAWGDGGLPVARETIKRAEELLDGVNPNAAKNMFPFLRKIPEWVPDFLQPWSELLQLS